MDLPWAEERVANGLSSGEGLIHAVRDALSTTDEEGAPKVLDPGVADKRLMVVEGEFGRVLKTMTREGNILSATVRSAWDGERLQSLTRNSPLRATGAHISIVGHITRSELRRLLSQTDTENGFANRFLWLLVRRSKLLPFGGEWHKVNIAPLVRKLAAALEFAHRAGEVRWGASARPLWEEVYPDLSEGTDGLLGAATSRAEAQVLRVAAIYALMDASTGIEREHLQAALSLWEYAEESARRIFGEATGDPVADRIVAALKERPGGMTRSEIRDLFGRHKTSARIDQSLSALAESGRISRKVEQSGGRPRERWRLA